MLVLGALLLSAMLCDASELRRTAVVKAVEGVQAAVVNIHGQKTVSGSYDQFGHAEAPRSVNGMGTGVVIDERGYIITNHHVVEDVRRIQVTLADGKDYYARVVSYDPRTDLAIIKINAPDKLPVARLGTSADLMTGEPVIAVGNAYGYEHTVTRGIISALHRTVQVSDTQEYVDLIQTDASINPGNSGGPLMNIDGDVVGINVAVRAGAQGIGFAIPIDRALDVATRLMSVERVNDRWHGVVAQSSGTSKGVTVDRVEADSPAEKAGLKPGDVIVEAAEVKIERSLDFERALIGRKTEEKIDITILRDGGRKSVGFQLADLPSRRRNSTQDRSWDALGMRLNTIDSTEFRRYRSKYRGGLKVSEVRAGSPASRHGIRPGDVLVGMHVWETISLDNIAYILNRSDLAELEPLKFYILRGNETLYGHLPVSPRLSQR